MKTIFPFLIALLCFTAFFVKVSGQVISSTPSLNKADSSKAQNTPFTIVYDIVVKSGKRKTDIEETYNGGTKAVFVNKDKARIRLVSLMRIQSLFFYSVNTPNPVSMVKESGKKKYKYNLTNDQWNLYNDKYTNDSCVFSNDSLFILNYLCRKAVIYLKDGRLLTTYYTTQFKPFNSKIEPAFKDIPGVVLQYEYAYKKGSILYTAAKISKNPIQDNVFKIPTKGYTLKKFSANSSTINEKDSPDDSID